MVKQKTNYHYVVPFIRLKLNRSYIGVIKGQVLNYFKLVL